MSRGGKSARIMGKNLIIVSKYIYLFIWNLRLSITRQGRRKILTSGGEGIEGIKGNE